MHKPQQLFGLQPTSKLSNSKADKIALRCLISSDIESNVLLHIFFSHLLSGSRWGHCPSNMQSSAGVWILSSFGNLISWEPFKYGNKSVCCLHKSKFMYSFIVLILGIKKDDYWCKNKGFYIKKRYRDIFFWKWIISSHLNTLMGVLIVICFNKINVWFVLKIESLQSWMYWWCHTEQGFSIVYFVVFLL